MRAYNQKLSSKVNAQLNSRERTVRIQKRFIAIAVVLILSIMILLGTSIHAFASSRNEQKTLYKYYTSIQVEQGDTLWSIADAYIAGYPIDKSDYIEEVCELNHLQNDEIHAGAYIVVACYSTEKR
jgi:cell division protein YceG involved in septum cleavage